MIQQLYETHLDVRDLECSMRFYEDVLHLERGFLDERRRISFYWVGPPKQTMLGLWEKDAEHFAPNRHIAFRIDIQDMERAIARLHEHEVATRNFSGGASDEVSVFAWMPAAAIYFNDPDGHLLEFIALLPGLPRPELGVLSLDAWTNLPQPQG